jgi:hypothetical protein
MDNNEMFGSVLIKSTEDSLTVIDVVNITNYEKQLGVYIYLNRNILPVHKIKALQEEKKRINEKLNCL